MKKRILSLSLASLVLLQSLLTLPPISAEETNGAEQSSAAPTARESTDPSAQAISYTHEISDAGLELIKSFEGYTPYPIWDHKQYSYGYGSYVDASTVYADPNSPTGYSTTLYPGGIPEREAALLLKEMADSNNVQLNNFLEKYKIELNQNQFDALASISYNLGGYIWTNPQNTLRNTLIEGNYTKERLTEVFGLYCYASGQRLEALYQRRMREAAIFFSEYSMSDPDADLYVVATSSNLVIRSSPSASSSKLGYIDASKIIRVHKYSADKKWAYTSYCGYYGWVSMDYLVSIEENEMVTEVSSSGYDDAGIYYTFDTINMTATVGSKSGTNSSKYNGAYSGEVYLTKYLLYKGDIYRLTSISDTAFTNCKEIKNIYIPSAVESIGANAFKGSTLKEIYYSDGSYAKDWAIASAFTATDLRCRDGHTYSKWQITVLPSATDAQTEERTCSVCLTKQTRRHVSIKITSYPTKTEYKEGFDFNPDGLAVKAVYSDGSSVPVSGFKVSGYNKNKIGKQTLTVSYSTFTATFTVEVTARVLTKISIVSEPTKLTYIEGQEISYDGLSVKASYDNNTTAIVDELKITGYNKDKVGKQTITVSYNGKKATFKVTVKAKTLTGIQIVDYPETMEYFCGDSFDPTGLRLKLSYDNGTTDYTTKDFKISGYDNTTPGTQTITVSYGNKAQTMRITMILNYLKSSSLQMDDTYISPVRAGMTVAELREMFESGDRVEVLRNGKLLPNTAKLSTGVTVRLVYNDIVQDTALLLVSGDLTGDGNCTISDFLMMSEYLMGDRELTAQELLVGDLNGDGAITLADYCALYPMTQMEDPSAAV